MGGFGSGRYGGRPTTESALRIETVWLFRERFAVPGERLAGTMTWNRNGEHSASIGYEADMRDEADAVLRLSYTRGSGSDAERVQQVIRLTSTSPQYGGKRWWLVCPFRGNRCGKLYLPPGGDRFAGRAAWRLGYQSQRGAHRDRPFDKLFRLQKKLGCDQGWEAGLFRPKGMWRRTFERHFQRYLELDEECDVTMGVLLDRLTKGEWRKR